jgi:hypothetical protein
LSPSYWIDYLGFITEGKLAAIFIKPSLGVSNWLVIYFINYMPTSFLAPLSPRHQYIVHTLDRSGGPVLCNSSHSAVKSGNTCDLIAFCFSYVMSRGDNSIPHKETRPVAEGLFNILDSGASLTTMIGCIMKYCRSFCADVNTLYASF